MQNKRNFYRVLHLQPDAPQAMVKSAYRTIMQKMKVHPDLGGDEWNASLINEAYATLSDPQKRKAYDKVFFAERNKFQASAQSQTQRDNNSAQTKKTEQTGTKANRTETNSTETKSTDSKSSAEQPNTENKKTQYSQAKSNQTQHNQTQRKKPRRTSYDNISSQSISCLFCDKHYPLAAAQANANCECCGSPLHMPDFASEESHDRRNWLRMPSGSAINIQTRNQFLAQQNTDRRTGYNVAAMPNTQRLQAQLVDISLTGIKLQTPISLPIGETLKIESNTLIALIEICNQSFAPNTASNTAAKTGIYTASSTSTNTAPQHLFGAKFLSLTFKQDKGSFVSTAV